MRLVNTQGRGGRQTRQMLRELELRGARSTARAMPVVQRIVGDVRKGGDQALRRYAAKLDGLGPQQPFEISRAEMEQAWEATPKTIQARDEDRGQKYPAIRQTADAKGMERGSRRTDHRAARAGPGRGGVLCAQRALPLPSTLLMTVIPAQVAGVERIVVVSAKPAKETLAAAALLGVSGFYRIGGAQAVAALAFGTESIRRVDKIVGPGNWYVTAAKKMVAFDCAIDMLAGPTEIVVTSESGDAVGIAADLVAQAEHDPEALAILITTNVPLAREVIREVAQRVKTNPIAKQAIEKNGAGCGRGVSGRSTRNHQPAGARASERRCERGPRLGCAMPVRCLSAGIRRSPWGTTFPGPTTHCRPAAWRRCGAG